VIHVGHTCWCRGEARQGLFKYIEYMTRTNEYERGNAKHRKSEKKNDLQDAWVRERARSQQEMESAIALGVRKLGAMANASVWDGTKKGWCYVERVVVRGTHK